MPSRVDDPRPRVSLPRMDGSVIVRAALFERLGVFAPLTVVRALPGAGKTTLAASWVRSLNPSETAVRWLSAADPADITAAMRRFVRVEGERRQVVVVDDAHLLVDPELAEDVADLLAAHARLHVVLLTRSQHPVVAEAQRRRIPVLTLGAPQLNLTRAEIGAFAASWGHPVTEAEASALMEQLGGWIGPTRSALEQRGGGRLRDGLHGVRHDLRERLLPEILDERSLHIAMLLAVDDEVTESHARELLTGSVRAPGLVEPAAVGSAIDALVRSCILDPVYREGTRLWTFPPPVQRVLRSLLTVRHPEEARRARGVVARLLAERGEEAERGRLIAHAREAGDWALLAAVWNEHGLSLAVDHPEATYLAYRDLPASALAWFPPLSMASSVVSALRPRGERMAGTGLIRSYAGAGWNRHYDGEGTDAHTLAVAARIIDARVGGDPFEAVRIAKRHTRGQEASRPTMSRAWHDLHAGVAAAAAADDVAATRFLTVAEHQGRATGAGFIASAAAAQLALIANTRGQTAEAEAHLARHRAIDTRGQWLHHVISLPSVIVHGQRRLDALDPLARDVFDAAAGATDDVEEWASIHAGKAQHALLFGDPLSALNALEQQAGLRADRIHPRSRDRRVTDRLAIELLLSLGEMNRAWRRLQDSDGGTAAHPVAHARLALICADPARARLIASTAVWKSETTLRDKAELFAIKAAAAAQMGDELAAAESYGHARALAAQIGTLLPFAKLGRELRERLTELSGVVPSADETSRLAEVRDPFPRSGELIILTPREMVVLHAMVEHETVAEIAEALTVSPNTVKKQTISIYTKLGEHDRASALLRAHRIGLLPLR